MIAGTDCGFGTFTNREWVIEPAVWLKLRVDPRRRRYRLGTAVGEEGGLGTARLKHSTVMPAKAGIQ